MIKRSLSAKLKYLSKKFPVISITGPRQSGKTTLVKDIFSGYSYYSLEDPDTREYAQTDPRAFLTKPNKGMIIDEIQRVPKLLSYIQTISDSSGKTGRFIITGSQNLLISQHISQTLAGRVAIITLLPFSVEELKTASFSLKNPYETIFKGMYPRIYDKKIKPLDWYPGYIQTYIERDIRSIKNISDLSSFQKFIKICAGRSGQVVNLSSIGNDCGITHNTAKAWLSILEASYIIFLLKPYHSNFNKRLIKMPKLYFYDTGLLCSLLGIKDSTGLETHYLRGSIFETFVLSEIQKSILNQGNMPECYYWRDKIGNEIDCIVDFAGKTIKIEIKSGKTIADDFFKGLKYWAKLSGSSKDSYIVYAGNTGQKRSQADIVSWHDIASLLEKHR